jgi:hypothetical protein
MRIIVAILSVFSLFSLSAQHLLPVQFDTNRINYELILTGTGDYSSNSVQNFFLDKFLFGGYIDQGIKDAAFEKQRSINRLGFDAHAELEFRDMKLGLFGDRWGYLIKTGYGSAGSVLYGKDAFGFIFYGNESFLGDTAELSGTRFQFQTYQKFGFGIVNKSSKSSISLNGYTLSNQGFGSLASANFYQTSLGDSISVELEGDFSVANHPSFIKGWGLGVDFDFRIPWFKTETNESFFQFSGKNVGVAIMHQAMKSYQAEKLFVYDGLRLNQLLGDESIFNDGFSVLDTLGVDTLAVTNTVRPLPGMLQFGKIINDMSKQRWQSYYGLRMFPTLSYIPMVYAGAQCRITDWFKMGANLSFGGFSKVRGGTYLQFDYAAFSCGISTENIVGLLSSKGYGRSLQFRLRCAF